MSRKDGVRPGPAPIDDSRGRESGAVVPLPARGSAAKGRGRAAADDLTDLPEELLKELRLGPRTSLDAQILDIFNALGGTATLDDVLIGLYRKFAVVQKRRFVQNAIWRMIRKGHLTAVRGARGRFSLASGPRGRKRDKA
jgi:hypothetical protein